ncbi:MAG: FtsX-like permease family protein [Thermoproteota archaeon]|nr:FtsX-like permease family protein [Thermoproteota archaeon]
MRLKRILATAWESMKQRRLRTSLTTLGVVIGITAIIALASLGEGFRSGVEGQMKQGFELDVLTIIGGSFFAGWEGFNETDVSRIRGIENVTMATPLMRMPSAQLYNQEKGNKNATALVTTAVNFTEFWKIYRDRLQFENGTLPSKNENETVILGYKVNHAPNETEVFADVNDTIKVVMREKTYVRTYNFTVTGVLRKTGASGLGSFDYSLFLSLEQGKKIMEELGRDASFEAICVKIADADFSESVAKKIEDLFPPYQVTILVPTTIMRQVDYVLTLVQIFLTSIASIALLVAGIGVMNIMTVSVMERTREIGILKAVGAKNRTVLIMFLAEAVLIGITGGVVGVPTGYGIAYGLSYVFSRVTPQQQNHIFGPPTEQTSITPLFSFWWALGAIIFGIVICILFGLYPAKKASKLDPVEALRYE